MDENALILPKGIVVNSPGITDEIRKKAEAPMSWDELFGLWQVYTTTTKALADPTAARLECFFWRIWGSRQRSLSSMAVAQLFADISTGDTYPGLGRLVSSKPRDESGIPLPYSSRSAGDLAVSQRPSPGPSPNSSAPSSRQALPENAQARTLPPPVDFPEEAKAARIDVQASDIPRRSSENGTAASGNVRPPRLQPPMPHPILKKTRGASTNGPKPTARFVAPDDGDFDEAVDDDHTNAKVVVTPPSPIDGKLVRTSSSQQMRRKIAANVGFKKRPTITRRPSSQSSTGSDCSSKSVTFADLPGEELTNGVHLNGDGPSVNQATSKFQERFSVIPENKHVTRTFKVKSGRPRAHMSLKRSTPSSESVALLRRTSSTDERQKSPLSPKTFPSDASEIDMTPPLVEQDAHDPIPPTQDVVDNGSSATQLPTTRETATKPFTSRGPSHASKRSVSAMSLSAAYLPSHPTASTAAAPTTSLAKTTFELPAEAQSVSPRIGDTAQAREPPSPGFFTRRSLISGIPSLTSAVVLGSTPPTATARAPSFSSSFSVRSGLSGVASNSASATNLQALLQRDDKSRRRRRDRQSFTGH